MALLFQDSCDNYAATDTLAVYGAGNAWNSMQTGLLGTGQCGRMNASGGGPQKALASAVTTIVVGFRFRTAALPGSSPIGMLALRDGSNNIVGNLCLLATGAVGWYRGNAATQVCVSSGGLIAINATNFIEVKVTLATGATGTVDVHVNGASVASASTIATANTTASASAFQWNAPGTNSDFDDMYVYDTTGTACNDFAGDYKIVTLGATGAGRIAQFTPNGAASNYLCVNQTTPDGDTTYVSSATAGQIDAYATGGIGSATAVKGVQVSVMARKDDANTRTLAIGVGNGTTENFDAGTNLGSTYVYLLRQLSTNPITGVAWTTSDFATLQAAIKCIA